MLEKSVAPSEVISSVASPPSNLPSEIGQSSSSVISSMPLSDWRGSITTFKGFTGTLPANELLDATWNEIVHLLRPEKPMILQDKKSGRYFVACALKEAELVGSTREAAIAKGNSTVGKMRSKSHVTESSLLVMDVDGLPEDDFKAGLDKIRDDELTFLAYTTHSHGSADKPGMRVRIVIPLDRPVDTADYAKAWHGFDKHYWSGLAGKADASGANMYQQQGTWCCHPDRENQANSWGSIAGVASADALIAIGKPSVTVTVTQGIPSNGSTEKNDGYPPSDANKVAAACKQIGAFRDTKGADQSEPLWRDCLGVVVHCENGEELCHEWSCGHPKYDACEADKKLAYRRKTPPTTCAQFRKSNPEGCDGCTNNCKSPVTLGWARPSADNVEVAKTQIAKASSKANSTKSQNMPFAEVEPHSDPISPAILLDEISKTFLRHIVMEEEQACAAALWVAFTWFVDAVEVAPLAIINAPERECGKSQLLDLMRRFCARPLSASNLTTAVLFRAIEHWSPTMLIDEADTFMRENVELKGLINAGHTRASAYVLRVVGDNHEPKKFGVWGAKALAGISLERHLPDSTMSRAIVFNLRRKLRHETVARLRHADDATFNVLTSKLARFAADYAEQVRLARPRLPDELSDRAQDNWEPLLAIAECAGPQWLQHATAAALKLSGKNDWAVSMGNELLADIRHVFESKKVDRIRTKDLIAALVEDEGMPWATYNRGKPLSPRQLAKQLAAYGAYGIKSKTVRHGLETPKGYELAQFQEAFARYLPTPEKLPQQRNDLPGSNNGDTFGVSDAKNVTATGSAEAPSEAGDSSSPFF